MQIPDDLPNPTGEYEDFLVGLLQLKQESNLLHYRMAGGKQDKLWMVCVAEHMSEALCDEIVLVSLMKGDGDERVNVYHPTEGAKTFWENGLAQGLSPKAILQGWKALMSIVNEGNNAGSDGASP